TRLLLSYRGIVFAQSPVVADLLQDVELGPSDEQLCGTFLVFVECSLWKMSNQAVPGAAAIHFIPGEHVPHDWRKVCSSNSEAFFIMSKVHPEGKPLVPVVESRDRRNTYIRSCSGQRSHRAFISAWRNGVIRVDECYELTSRVSQSCIAGGTKPSI